MAVIERKEGVDGKPSYRVLIRRAGFKPISATFPKISDARTFAAKKEGELRLRKYGMATAADHHTAEEMIDRYIATIQKTKSHKKKFLRQQTRQLLWWKKELSGLVLSQISPAIISEKRDKLQRLYQPSTVNNYLSGLSAVYRVAKREWEWVEISPFEKVQKLKVKNAGLRFLSKEEIKALLNSCRKEKKKPLWLIVVIALSTGARKSEILGLRWRDVQIEFGTIGFAIAHDTKNSESRRLYLTGKAIEGLRAYKAAEYKPWRSNWFVFANRWGNGSMSINREFATALKDAGIKNFRFHDLRHTAASYLAMNGANASDIAEVLGHKSLDMVKRYAHLSEKHTAGVIASMNDKILGENA